MAEEAGRGRGRRRAVALVGGGLVLLVGLAAGILVARRHEVAEWYLLRAIARRGLSPASLSVPRFGPDRLDVADLRIGHDAVGEADLRVARIETRFSPASLLAGRLEEARIAGVRVRGRYGEGGLSLGALDPLLAPTGDEAPAGTTRVPVLPARAIQVGDARAALATPAGPVTIDATLDVAEDAAERLSGSVQLDAAGPGANGRAHLAFAGPREALEGELSVELEEAVAADEPGGTARQAGAFAFTSHVALAGSELAVEIPPAPFAIGPETAGLGLRASGETPRVRVAGRDLQTEGGRLALPDAGVEVSGLGLEARLDPQTLRPSGRVRIARVRDAHRPARFPDLALDATFEADGERVAFDGAASGAEGRLVLRARGTHELEPGRGEAAIRLEPVAFAEGGLQPADLAPVVGSRIQRASGSVGADGTVTWSDAGLRGGVDVAVRDLSVATPPVALEQLNAAVHVDGPPVSIPSGQLASMARVDAGIVLTNGLVRFGMGRDGALEIASAEWRFAGGTIRTSGRLDPKAERNSLVLEIADADLGELLALVKLDGLSGEGRMGGRLPVTLAGDSVRIDRGRLEAKGDGWVRYRPGGAAESAGGGNSYYQTLLSALENFHFEKAELTLDGDARGEVDVGLRLLGSNPDFAGGQRYDFPIHVDAHLLDLIAWTRTAYEIPERIEKRVESILSGRD